MMNLRLLILVFCGLLVACSETNNASEDQKIPAVIPADIPPVPSEIDIQETALPIIEDFGAANSIEFFSPTYKPLATPASHALSDGTTLVDTLPSFFYPTCCLFQTDDVTGQQLRDPPQYADDINFRLKVGQNKLAISNARFTIGQILSDLTPENVVDRKVNTTNGAIAVLGSWGELDLSRPYRISFCLVDVLGSSNLEVYADNNSGGSQAQSIHGSLSLLLRTPVTGLTPGNRLVIEVPGNVFQVDNSGNQVGNPLGVASSLQVGRSRSFIQIRVSSGGHVVISDLVIERQNQNNAAGMTCAADTSFWVPPYPFDLELVPGDSELEVSWSASAGATGYDIAYNNTDSLSGATIAPINSGSTTSYTITGLTNGATYFVFIRARYPAENSDYSSSESAVVNPPPVPPATPTNLNAVGDNTQIGVTWNASVTASAYDVAYNTIDDPDVADGATVISDIVTTSTTITGLANGTTYFVFVRAKNAAGSSAFSASDSAIPLAVGPHGVDRIWTGSPEMAEATYASILVTTPPAGGNNNVAAGTNASVNGLSFFATTAGPVRHRSTVNEFNYNGSSYTSDVATPSVGSAAPATRVYIGVPVELGRPVTISALHRNSSSGVTDNSVKLVFIGSDGTVICIGNAASNASAGITTPCVLPNGHSQTEVRIIYSREGTGVGGQHLTTITRDYQDN